MLLGACMQASSALVARAAAAPDSREPPTDPRGRAGNREVWDPMEDAELLVGGSAETVEAGRQGDERLRVCEAERPGGSRRGRVDSRRLRGRRGWGWAGEICAEREAGRSRRLEDRRQRGGEAGRASARGDERLASRRQRFRKCGEWMAGWAGDVEDEF